MFIYNSEFHQLDPFTSSWCTNLLNGFGLTSSVCGMCVACMWGVVSLSVSNIVCVYVCVTCVWACMWRACGVLFLYPCDFLNKGAETIQRRLGS